MELQTQVKILPNTFLMLLKRETSSKVSVKDLELKNKQKSVFDNYDAIFDSSGWVYNIIAKKVLSEKEADRF